MLAIPGPRQSQTLEPLVIRRVPSERARDVRLERAIERDVGAKLRDGGYAAFEYH